MDSKNQNYGERQGAMTNWSNKMKRFLQNWWYDIDNIFYFQFEFSYKYIGISFKILGLGFNFDFHLPIPQLYDFRQREIICYSSSSKNNKAYEHQLSICDSCTTGIVINVPIHQDHGGFTFYLSLLGLFYYFCYYDIRHWDYETNNYKEVKDI